MAGIGIVLLITAAANVSIGAYVLSRDVHEHTHQAFSIFTLGSALWIGGFGMLLLTQLELFISILNVGGVISLLGAYLLSLAFLGATVNSIALAGLAPFPLMIAIATYPSLLITSVSYSKGMAIPVQGPIFPYYTLWFASYVAITLTLMVLAYLRAEAHKRVQLQYLFLGMGIFVLAALLCDVLLPALGFFALNYLGPLASVIFIGAAGYAIAQHQLMDIRLVIERSAVYTGIVLSVLGTYVLGVALAARSVGLHAEQSNLIAITMALVVGVFGSRAIEHRIGSILKPVLFGTALSAEAALEDLSQLLATDASMQEKLAQIANIVHKLFLVEYCFIAEEISGKRYGVLPSEGFPTNELPYAFRLTIRFHTNVYGELVLGAKISGEPFTDKDRSLLRAIARLLAVSMRGSFNQAELKDLLRSEHQTSIDELSHALQSPLTALKSSLGMLQTGHCDADPVTYRRMENSVDRMSHMIRTMLDLSRAHADNYADKANCDASAALLRILEYVKTIAEANDIELSQYISSGIIVAIPERHFEEVATNLISNALRYTAGCPTRTVQVTFDRVEHNALLTVTDSGTGIAPEDLPRVCERFYRSKHTNTREGTGLGLTIVRRVVNNCGGSIKIGSTVGTGTTVTVHIPLAEAAREAV